MNADRGQPAVFLRAWPLYRVDSEGRRVTIRAPDMRRNGIRVGASTRADGNHAVAVIP